MAHGLPGEPGADSMETQETPCAGTRYHNYHSYPCRYPGKMEHDGKWWCGVHDPVKKKQRRKAQHAKWDANAQAREEDRSRQEETLRRASHYDALVEALRTLSSAVNQHGKCVCGHDGKLTSDDCPLHGVGAIMARAVLAQIAAKEE